MFKNKKSKGLGANYQSTISGSICDDYYLQYTHPGHGDECELNIGLDFGTSSSKVVIQAPDLPGHPSYAVDFGKFSHESMHYLLPTKLWVSPDGFCSIEPCNGAKLIKDIKIDLFLPNRILSTKNSSTQDQFSTEESAACYLALLLRFSRRWFLETKKDHVRDFKKFIWNFNLGVPSPCVENNQQHRTFQRVGKVAWKLSTLKEELITFKKARTELKLVNNPDYWADDDEFACDFEIIPEIAAGAVGYALSELRREGLHVMVDIGASTIDVCSFKISEKEGINHYSLLIADVQPLGTIGLYYNFLDQLNRVYSKHNKELLEKHDPMVPMDEDIENYLISRDKALGAFEETKDQYKEQLLAMLRKVVLQTKGRRDPNAPVWRKGRLPVLLIGGGTKMPFFRSTINEFHEWVKGYIGNDGVILLTPPMPKNLINQSNNQDEYQFLAVTWGLSHRPLDIGDITPADSIPDVHPPRVLNHRLINWRSRYVGKELT